MPFPLKTAIASVVGLGAVVVGLTFLLGNDPDPGQESGGGTVSAVSGPLASLARPDGSIFEVFGPTCYQDSRGNDTIITSAPNAQVDCFVFSKGGADLVDLSARPVDSPVLIAISSTDTASQRLRLGLAPDYIEVQGSYNLTIEGAVGKNAILSLPQLSSSDVRFTQEGRNVVIATPNGNITLIEQVAGSALEGPIAHLRLANDIWLAREQMQVQSVVGQGTPGNDRIISTNADDVIFPGLGNDHITLIGGDNRIHYEGGNDYIMSTATEAMDNYLFVPFPRSEVAFQSENSSRDLVLVTPAGTITLALQLFYPVGDLRIPIQRIVFSDGPVLDADLRFLMEVQEEERNQGSAEERMRVRQ